MLEITPVGSDDGQAPENVSVAFASSIRNAEQVIDNRFASQDEINLAEVVLGSAITDFEQVVDGVSTQLLLQKIYDAQALLFNTPVGDRNGSVPEEAKQAFQLSLTSAQGVISDSNSGKQAMIAARIALSQAMDTFNGSKIVVDKKALSGRIDEAAFLLSDLKVGIRQGQVAPVPYQELGTALQAAQATYSDETVSQQTINNRIAELGGKIQALKDSIALTDIEFLRLKIREAELMVQYAVIGTEPWNATVPGVNALTYARLAAIEVSDEPASTATQITAAIDSLTLALAAFEQSRVPELTISLAPNAEFVLNNVTSEKVHISDLEGKNYDKTYQYTKRNILDLVRVKKGDQEQFLKYDAQLGNFKIYDDSNFQKYTGRTLTVTSVSPELRIIAASKGAQISQINLSDNTKAEIEINLIKEGREISDVKLPVTVDHDKPVWTSTVYDPSTTQFTLTSSERVSAPNSNYGQTGGTKSARIDFQYSPKGTFEDGDIVRTSAIPVINGNQLTFLLNPELKKLNRPAGSKFRVILNDITDYAYNEADIQTFDFDAASSGSNPSQP
ncbi:hypothetical protein [Saccharibacillus sp. WB 17]|uniref:hypothetical protein n=1 Tax=Saccharibacillus sp. WB 17 TaxID=2603535 RepID=UPI001313047A|nr:hypothetical protein [Saccharibacillus sp. WB 17]MWJ30156.1 hypothetical protein [Saccharibacillus sp. WB 17]